MSTRDVSKIAMVESRMFGKSDEKWPTEKQARLPPKPLRSGLTNGRKRLKIRETTIQSNFPNVFCNTLFTKNSIFKRVSLSRNPQEQTYPDISRKLVLKTSSNTSLREMICGFVLLVANEARQPGNNPPSSEKIQINDFFEKSDYYYVLRCTRDVTDLIFMEKWNNADRYVETNPKKKLD